MNIFAHFEGRIGEAISSLERKGILGPELETRGLKVESPRDPDHGDLALNVAMVLAKSAGMKPRDLAAHFVAEFERFAEVASAEIAGPGFINLRLAPRAWTRVLEAILDDGLGYGRSRLGGGRKVNVEYVSANPTGPMHVGHCRGAVFGDALANLLAFTGHDVTREYYINDAGVQIDVLARSVFLRYRQALGEDIGEIPEGLYPGDYLVPVGKMLAEKHGSSLIEMGEQGWLALVRKEAVDAMMAMIREDLAALNITFDVFFSEKSLHEGGEITEMVEDLRTKGYVYEGRLPPPKGKPPEDWEDREQLLFKASEFGDDIDRPLAKSDGSYTYFAADVAYFRNKFERGFDEMVYVLGADHGGYVKRLKAICQAISGGKAELIVRLCQLVKLYRGGEPVRMSKRAGTFVTLRDVVDEVGRDPVRFMMLYRKNEAPLDFDFVAVMEQSRDNPVFYVQMAHARACSVMRNASEVVPSLGPDGTITGEVDLDLLTDEGELQLMKRLAQYPRLVESAAEAHEPHRVAFYLYDVASDLHGQWNRGTDSPQLRFIREDDHSLTVARYALVKATAAVIASGLTLLGVDAPQEMR